MFDNFMDDFIELESVVPGIVFGTIAILCNSCGGVSEHEANEDGSTVYVCPHCSELNEV